MLSYGLKFANIVKYEFKLGTLVKSAFIQSKHTKSFCTMIDEKYTKDPMEIEIKVPYGHIAAKMWNDCGKKVPIVAVHGWLDNSGTWDLAAPLIDSDHPLLAFDFPGHGLSSHLPAGAGGYFMDNLVAIERVIDHFQWKQFILLGHSMGGAACLLYAGTFPERVKKLIMLDMLRPVGVEAEDQPTSTAKFLTELLPAEKKFKTDPPRYELDELVNKLLVTYHGSLTSDSARILLKRGAKKHGDGKYSLRYSPILRIPSGLSMSFEQQKAFAADVTCGVLVIKSSTAPVYGKTEDNQTTVELLKKNVASFQFSVAQGSHHVHLNDPECVVPLINDFLRDVPQSEQNRIEGDQYILDNL